MVERTGTERVRYRFSPLERRGVVAGWRGGQIAAVAAGLLLAVLAVRSQPSVGGILVALGSTGLGVALAFWPISGRTGEQWLPLAVRWWWATVAGGHRQLAFAPSEGHRLSVRPTGSEALAVLSPRPGWAGRRRSPFDGVSLFEMPFAPEPADSPAGILVDGPSRTVTAVMIVRGHGFALLGPGDQDARIASWARVLAAVAREGSEVHRLQWLESSGPDDGGAVRRHWHDHAVLGHESAAGQSYGALVDESSPVTRRHQVLVAVSVHRSHASRSIRASGGGITGATAVLAREMHSLHRALDGADISVEGVLGPAALARVLAATWAGGTGGTSEAPETKPDSTWPWPMGVETEWDAIRADGTWHATYWIAEWPRVDVTPDFLGPLMFSPLRRSIALVMEPVSPSRAARQVAQARTADLADGELRRRGGFLVTARHSREKESVEERDGELADGHAQYRFSGYVTVTADTRDELRTACAAVEQAAGQARIELRLLYGEQDAAFTCTLPLGRGLS
jgi:hypothetical protein